MFNYQRLIHWSLLAVVILYLLSGLGVTYFRVVEPLTFGLLNKAVSMRIHDFLIYIFLPLLIVHLYLTISRTLKH